MSRKVFRWDWITRYDVVTHPDWIFLFGDNTDQRGLGGQAKEMRGEFNVIGIPTKWLPDNKAASFFNDSQFNHIKGWIDAAFDKIPDNVTIIIPKNFGNGLSMLDKKAPKVLRYINKRIKEL